MIPGSVGFRITLDSLGSFGLFTVSLDSLRKFWASWAAARHCPESWSKLPPCGVTGKAARGRGGGGEGGEGMSFKGSLGLELRV